MSPDSPPAQCITGDTSDEHVSLMRRAHLVQYAIGVRRAAEAAPNMNTVSYACITHTIPTISGVYSSILALRQTVQLSNFNCEQANLPARALCNLYDSQSYSQLH